jgi:hypothetical protein
LLEVRPSLLEDFPSLLEGSPGLLEDFPSPHGLDMSRCLIEPERVICRNTFPAFRGLAGIWWHRLFGVGG